MEFIDPELQNYSEAHTSPESGLLKKINRDTHSLVMKPRMLSGHMQGRFLSFISKMIKPKIPLSKKVIFLLETTFLRFDKLSISIRNVLF